ncbi:MAG: hypothetical protein E7774_10085 [Bradyrhizobium sp.]|nr:MAG: hypothetical protein E7774_10085 [Bradyrhizobium sp.]
MDAKLDQTHTTRRIGSTVKYEGALAEPLPKPSANWSDEERAERQAKRDQKEVELMRFHNVDPTGPDAKAELLIALENCHVPGFRHEAPKQGRPRERARDDYLYWQLLELGKRIFLYSERRASEEIQSLGIFKGSAETLRTRHVRWKRHKENEILVRFVEHFAERSGEDVALYLSTEIADYYQLLIEKHLRVASQKLGPVHEIPPNGEWTWGVRKSRSRA